jgi:hypothetical protein
VIYRGNLDRQKNLAVRDMELGFTQFNRDSLLFISGVISTAEYEKAQTMLLNSRRRLKQAD